jgi:bacterioferritin-associated ferredoxin
VYVCICHAVTDLRIDQVIAQGARTEEEIGEATGAGTSCGGCVGRICNRLARADAGHLVSHAVALSA